MALSPLPLQLVVSSAVEVDPRVLLSYSAPDTFPVPSSWTDDVEFHSQANVPVPVRTHAPIYSLATVRTFAVASPLHTRAPPYSRATVRRGLPASSSSVRSAPRTTAEPPARIALVEPVLLHTVGSAAARTADCASHRPLRLGHSQ